MLHREEERYLEIVERFAKRIDAEEPQSGDIVLFRFGRCLSHGAIVTKWPEVVHAYRPAGCVTIDDALANPDLEKRIAGFWSVWD